MQQSIEPELLHRVVRDDLVVRSNLKKLAQFLWELPADYHKFSMDYYCTYVDDDHLLSGIPGSTAIFFNEYSKEKFNACSTVACAVGHSIAAGVQFPSNVDSWQKAASYLVENDKDVMHWLFIGEWVDIDNTSRGAAQRIVYFLKFGLPYFLQSSPKDSHPIKPGTIPRYLKKLTALTDYANKITKEDLDNVN